MRAHRGNAAVLADSLTLAVNAGEWTIVMPSMFCMPRFLFSAPRTSVPRAHAGIIVRRRLRVKTLSPPNHLHSDKLGVVHRIHSLIQDIGASSAASGLSQSSMGRYDREDKGQASNHRASVGLRPMKDPVPTHIIGENAEMGPSAAVKGPGITPEQACRRERAPESLRAASGPAKQPYAPSAPKSGKTERPIKPASNSI